MFTTGVANGKSETRRDAETGILKSKTETGKFSDLIEKHICDRRYKIWDSETQYQVVRDSKTWVEIAETSHFSEYHSPPFTTVAHKCTPNWNPNSNRSHQIEIQIQIAHTKFLSLIPNSNRSQIFRSLTPNSNCSHLIQIAHTQFKSFIPNYSRSTMHWPLPSPPPLFSPPRSRCFPLLRYEG